MSPKAYVSVKLIGMSNRKVSFLGTIHSFFIIGIFTFIFCLLKVC